MKTTKYSGWGLSCCLLLAACPGGGDETGTGTGTTTTTTGDTTTTTASTTSTTDGPTTTSGTTDEPTSTTTTTTTGGEGPLADCQAQYAELEKQIQRSCECEVEAGFYPDVQTCLEDIGAGEDVGCICEIQAADPENAAYFACIAKAEADYTVCFLPLACGDETGLEGCIDTYLEATVDCGFVSKGSSGETDVKCYGAPAFMCGSGEQVPEYYTCDEEADCMDMSDEADAECNFTCGSGETIPKFSLCDGSPDCMDMSDETKEMCVFTCMNGEEVPKSYQCDGEADCEDMSDEANCP